MSQESSDFATLAGVPVASKKRKREDSSEASPRKRQKPDRLRNRAPNQNAAPKPTGKKPGHSRSKSRRGGKNKRLEEVLLARLKKTYTKHLQGETHPMFGKFKTGLCRAPYIVFNSAGEEDGAKVSWRKICRVLASRIGNPRMSEKKNCWMAKASERNLPMVSFNKSKNGSPKVYRKTLAVRALKFLMNPTVDMWEWLNETCSTSGFESGRSCPVGRVDRPFDHDCHRGQFREGQQDRVCINPFHGYISTKEANEDRKLCSRSCRVLCPGHGPTGTRHCVYTAPDGRYLPCLNDEQKLGPCKCKVKCFVNLRARKRKELRRQRKAEGAILSQESI